MKLVRDLQILPGFDKRNPDPKKNYGIHGCTLRFYVHDSQKERSVQFVAYTDWTPLHVQKENMGGEYGVRRMDVIGEQPMAADLGYHSPKPLYEGQTKMDCDLNERGFCYYDGSGLNAEPVRNALLEKGSDGVWEKLEEYWHSVFDKERTGGGFGETLKAFGDALEEAAE